MLLNPDHAIALHRVGFDRDEVLSRVWAAAATPKGHAAPIQSAMVRGEPRRDDEQLDHAVTSPDRIVLAVCGAPGSYVRPTVFGEVDNSMTIAREEIFGPVLSVIPYADEADAVRIANDSSYGLHGGVWSADAEHGVEIAREVRTGVVSVNGAFAGFDVPFGGYKCSGLGRAFGSVGLSEYLEYKAIAV